MMIFVISR